MGGWALCFLRPTPGFRPRPSWTGVQDSGALALPAGPRSQGGWPPPSASKAWPGPQPVSTWDPSCHHCGSTIFAKVAAAGPCPRRHFLAPHSIMGRLRLRAGLRGKKQGSQPTAQPCAPWESRCQDWGTEGSCRGWAGDGGGKGGSGSTMSPSCCFRGQAGRGLASLPRGCRTGRAQAVGQGGSGWKASLAGDAGPWALAVLPWPRPSCPAGV